MCYLFNECWKRASNLSFAIIKKFTKIWLQLHQFVHYEIVYFFLFYTLHSHIFSLAVQISDSPVPFERATFGGQSDSNNWSSVQEKSFCHFDYKQSFAIHFLWEHLTILTNSFISCDMFGLFRIRCQILLEQLQQALVWTCNTNSRSSK